MKSSLVYWLHKWLAVVAAVATLGWFVSGMLMVVPASWRTLSPGIARGISQEWRQPDGPQFEDAGVTAAAAIEAVRARVGLPLRVSGVRLRRLPGRLTYEIATERRGIYLVDAVTGAIVTVDEQLALRIAAASAGSAALGPVTLDKQTTPDCQGPTPTYRIPVADGKGTVFCVSRDTAELRYTDRLTRVIAVVVGWHDFSLLRSYSSPAIARLSLFAFAAIGTLMSVAGVLILFTQFNRWRGASGGRRAIRSRV